MKDTYVPKWYYYVGFFLFHYFMFLIASYVPLFLLIDKQVIFSTSPSLFGELPFYLVYGIGSSIIAIFGALVMTSFSSYQVYSKESKSNLIPVFTINNTPMYSIYNVMQYPRKYYKNIKWVENYTFKDTLRVIDFRSNFLIFKSIHKPEDENYDYIFCMEKDYFLDNFDSTEIHGKFTFVCKGSYRFIEKIGE